MLKFVNPESIKQMADQLSNLGRLAEKVPASDVNASPIDQEAKSLEEKAFMLPRSGGEWSGEPGNSTWYPDRDEIPKNKNYSNLENKTWGQILDEYGIDGIPFKDGEPDFSEVSKATVEIDDFSTRRFGAGGNFDQADQKIAEQRGCTTEEVQQWRADHVYTWHEKQDGRTMEKVPREVHHNVPHTGGVAILKSKQTETE